VNQTAVSFPQTDAGPDRRVSFSRRLRIYFAVWLLTALAFQVFLQPEGLTVTDLTPIQQRIRWPFYTPVMAVVGLAQAFTWPAFPQASAGFAAAGGLVLHAMFALTRARRSSFIALTSAQALLLTVAVIYFVRQSQLPRGG
jgi:hypothetical protein